jgi:hypothetical protein
MLFTPYAQCFRTYIPHHLVSLCAACLEYSDASTSSLPVLVERRACVRVDQILARLVGVKVSATDVTEVLQGLCLLVARDTIINALMFLMSRRQTALTAVAQGVTHMYVGSIP